MMSKILKLITLAAASSLVTGCINMSGISGSTDTFSCKAPEGIPCTSVSGTYANAVQNNLPGSKKASSSEPMPEETRSPSARIGMIPGAPLRSPSRTLRVWFAPNEDSDRDFWDERYCYMVVDSGHWMVEHSRAKLAEHYRPAIPALKSAPIPVTESKPAIEAATAKQETTDQDKSEAADHTAPAPGDANNVP